MGKPVGFAAAFLACSVCSGQSVEALREECTVLQEHKYNEIARRAGFYSEAISKLLTVRKWQDRELRFAVDARCVAHANDTAGDLWIQLERIDGSKVSVKVESLSSGDRKSVFSLDRAAMFLKFVAKGEAAGSGATDRRKAAIIQRFDEQSDWDRLLEQRGKDWPDKGLANAKWLMTRLIDCPDDWITKGETLPSPDGSGRALLCPFEYTGPTERLGTSRESIAVISTDRMLRSMDILAASVAADEIRKKGKLGRELKPDQKPMAIHGLSITAFTPVWQGATGQELAEKAGLELSPPNFNDAATIAWWQRFLTYYEQTLNFRDAYEEVYAGKSESEKFSFFGSDLLHTLYEWYIYLTHKQGQRVASVSGDKGDQAAVAAGARPEDAEQGSTEAKPDQSPGRVPDKRPSRGSIRIGLPKE
jgi:hypothetical protein